MIFATVFLAIFQARKKKKRRKESSSQSGSETIDHSSAITRFYLAIPKVPTKWDLLDLHLVPRQQFVQLRFCLLNRGDALKGFSLHCTDKVKSQALRWIPLLARSCAPISLIILIIT
jgi:hypothetical protein